MFIRTIQGGNRSINAYKSERHYPAAATVATKTIAAVVGVRHILEAVYWSYSANPTGGLITVEAGSGNIIFKSYITAGGPGMLPVMRLCPENTALIVTLASGGGSVIGTLDFDYYSEGSAGIV